MFRSTRRLRVANAGVSGRYNLESPTHRQQYLPPLLLLLLLFVILSIFCLVYPSETLIYSSGEPILRSMVDLISSKLSV
jgi:hypothetical protein